MTTLFCVHIHTKFPQGGGNVRLSKPVESRGSMSRIIQGFTGPSPRCSGAFDNVKWERKGESWAIAHTPARNSGGQVARKILSGGWGMVGIRVARWLPPGPKQQWEWVAESSCR